MTSWGLHLPPQWLPGQIFSVYKWKDAISNSLADSTWDLKIQLCSLCFLFRLCNEHAPCLTTVLLVREVEYNLACLFCEGFSGSPSRRGIKKNEGFFFFVILFKCICVSWKGLRNWGDRIWKYRTQHDWIRKFYFCGAPLNSPQWTDGNWRSLYLTKEQPTHLSLLW